MVKDGTPATPVSEPVPNVLEMFAEQLGTAVVALAEQVDADPQALTEDDGHRICSSSGARELGAVPGPGAESGGGAEPGVGPPGPARLCRHANWNWEWTN